MLAHPSAGRLRRDNPVDTDTSEYHKTTVPTRPKTTDQRPNDQRSTDVSGPHEGYDPDGDLDHRFFRCERCGLESTDARLREGCWRCADERGKEDGKGEDSRG